MEIKLHAPTHTNTNGIILQECYLKERGKKILSHAATISDACLKRWTFEVYKGLICVGKTINVIMRMCVHIFGVCVYYQDICAVKFD